MQGSILYIYNLNGQITSVKISHQHPINMQRFIYYSVKILRRCLLHVCFNALDIPCDRKIPLMLRIILKGFYPRFYQVFWQGHIYPCHSSLSAWMLSTLLTQHVSVWKCTFSQPFTCVKYSPRCIIMCCISSVLVPSALSHCITVLCWTLRIPGNKS